MRLVYLAHPYGGDEKNVEDAKQTVRRLVKQFPGKAFLPPLQATGFLYEDVPYIDGMNMCIEILSRCDELWLCPGWQDSKGCCMEYAVARVKGIPVVEVANPTQDALIRKATAHFAAQQSSNGEGENI